RLGIFSGNYSATAGAAPAFSAKVDYLSVLSGGSPIADLTVRLSHTGNFTRGQTGALYSITVNNSGAGSATSQTTVTDTLPAGLPPAAASGPGWNCSIAGQTVTCVTSSVMGPGSSASPISLTVNVSASAPASAVNTVVVSGGGETNTSNDTASDSTTIGAVSG